MGKIVKREDYQKQLNLEEQVELDEGVEMGAPLGEERVISQEVYGASGEARRIIEEAREEARKIKKEAEGILRRVQEEMEKAKKKGFEEGREKGLGEITQLLTAAVEAKEKMFDGIEREAVRLVYDIAEKILGQEFSQRETAIVDLVKQALHSAIGQKIVILVNPHDLETIKQHQSVLVQTLDATRSIQLRGDEKVKPNGCLIESEVGTIDAQLETQLKAIRTALGLEGDHP